MVVPVLPLEPEAERPGVWVARDSAGVFIGFRDPSTGQFISRQDALPRLTYSIELGELQDSLGNTAGVGSIGLPGRGVRVTYATTETVQDLVPLETNPATYAPKSNQEIVERVIFTDSDGNLITLETSWGAGTKYDSHLYGGRWRRGAAEALGLEEGTRLPTADLERAVLYREFIIRTTTP
jgi:hypothetical protein